MTVNSMGGLGVLSHTFHEIKVVNMGSSLASRVLVISIIVALGICFLFSKIMVKEDAVVVNLALKEEGKVYVFSFSSAKGVKQQILKNSSPSVGPFIQVFEEDELHYVQPKDIKEIVNILCGNYRIHEYPEQRFDGYITTTQMKCLNHFVRNENTSKIVEQMKVHEMSLSSPVSDSLRVVRWSSNYLSGETQILENCQKKQFRVAENPHPGETFVCSKEFIVVNLEEMGSFYSQKVSFELDKKNQLLYIEKRSVE
ncbi:hypothetical protein [Flagellimonas sp.]|uniref:hypothetical protein n=1 Tax=Flagellimonas sp. TaxID=2058762 RepID=UPI003F4A46F9